MFLLKNKLGQYFQYRGKNGPIFLEDREEARRFSSRAKAKLEMMTICYDLRIRSSNFTIEPEENGQEKKIADIRGDPGPIQFVGSSIYMLGFEAYRVKAVAQA